MSVRAPTLRRRQIEDRDLESVIKLLSIGFPTQSEAWWRRGFETLRCRTSPLGYPRYGRLLEANGFVVGVLLTIYAETHDSAGAAHVRCNLSSWYVERAFAGHAPLLLGSALRDKNVTYVNVSPASHTQPIIEAQGFRSFATGSLVTVPLLATRHDRTRVRTLTDADRQNWSDGHLLADHAAMGCSCLVVETLDGPHPFVFSRPRLLRKFLKASQLLYCRDIADYIRFAAAIGPSLLRHGCALILVDGVQKLSGVPGREVNKGQRKYAYGPHIPRPGDLAYTELAVFG